MGEMLLRTLNVGSNRINMKEVHLCVKQAIAELQPATQASCPNELAMRAAMALICINNAFLAACLNPLEIIIPFEDAPAIQGELFEPAAAGGEGT